MDASWVILDFWVATKDVDFPKIIDSFFTHIFGSGATHTRSKTTLFKRPRFCQRKMCKFDLITLRWHQQIFQSLPSDTNPHSSRQSVKQSSLYGFFLLFPDGTRSNPTTKELKIDSKSHQQWNIRAKLFVSLLILLQLLKKFCCSTRRCFF